MKNKTAFVIGASRGLGAEIANTFITNGYKVVGTSSQADKLLELEERLGFPFHRLDFSVSSEIATDARDLLRAHGIPDVVIINGAIGSDKLLSTMHDSEILQTINTNLTGALLATKYLARPMLVNGKGSVVLIGSITAKTGYSGLSAYGAAKAGLEGAVRGLSRELGKGGVRINIVHPGFMDTAMTSAMDTSVKDRIASRSPFRRFVTTSEVAEAVFFLGSEKSSGISGANITVDLGGTA